MQCGRPWPTAALVGFDLETTGLDLGSARPVSVAFTGAYQWCGLIDPGIEIPPEATSIHRITTALARSEGLAYEPALRRITEALARLAEEEAVLVGMNLRYDLSLVEARACELGLPAPSGMHLAIADVLVIDRHHDRFRPGRRNLDALCRHYGITHTGPHEAASDAQAALDIARAEARRYPGLAALDASALTAAEAAWHRAWAEHYSDWLASQGRSRLAARELAWPYQLAGQPADGY